jgi:hypothetical protein
VFEPNAAHVLSPSAWLRALQSAMTGIANTLGRDAALVRHARPIYERALALLTAGRGIPWTINGADFRISPFQRHRMGSLYDTGVAEFLSKRVRPGAVCFDVGANVGVYALQFARWTGPSGRVFAFEPNPISAGILAEHVRMNDVAARVEIVRAAVAGTSGTQTFTTPGWSKRIDLDCPVG